MHSTMAQKENISENLSSNHNNHHRNSDSTEHHFDSESDGGGAENPSKLGNNGIKNDDETVGKSSEPVNDIQQSTCSVAVEN